MKRKKDTEIVCFFVFLLLRENSLLFSSYSTLSPPAPPLPLSAAPARGAVASLQDLLDLGKLPLLVAQRARGAGLEPSDCFFLSFEFGCFFWMFFFLFFKGERVSFSKASTLRSRHREENLAFSVVRPLKNERRGMLRGARAREKKKLHLSRSNKRAESFPPPSNWLPQRSLASSKGEEMPLLRQS